MFENVISLAFLLFSSVFIKENLLSEGRLMIASPKLVGGMVSQNITWVSQEGCMVWEVHKMDYVI